MPEPRRPVRRSTARPAAARRTRATYHHGDLPRALRAAAVRLVAERGVEGFTLREAARLVGVHHAAAYRHFADKRALLADIAEEGYRALAKRMQEADVSGPSRDPGERVRRVATAYVEFARDEPALFGLMTGPRLNEDGRFPSLERALEEGVAALEAPLRDGQANGTFAVQPVATQALAVLTLAHGYASFVLTRRIRVRPSRVGELLGALLAPLLAGLRAR